MKQQQHLARVGPLQGRIWDLLNPKLACDGASLTSKTFFTEHDLWSWSKRGAEPCVVCVAVQRELTPVWNEHIERRRTARGRSGA